MFEILLRLLKMSYKLTWSVRSIKRLDPACISADLNSYLVDNFIDSVQLDL